VKETGKTVLRVAALGVLSVLVGASFHFPLVKRFVRGEFRESFLSRAEYPGIRLITLREAEDLWAEEAAVVLDARPERLFRAGRVPRSRSLPPVESGGRLPAEVVELPRDGTVIVYCEGGDCQSSLALAKHLHDEGFRDIRVMTGGWEEWERSGLPVEKGDGKD
jgi:rhodanese-related sulfurtransferase